MLEGIDLNELYKWAYINENMNECLLWLSKFLTFVFGDKVIVLELLFHEQVL